MNPIIKSILIFIGAVAIGMFVILIVQQIGAFIIPPPEGVDSSSLEKARESIKLLEPKHFIMPFITHFLCCFSAGWFAAKFAPIGKIGMALSIGTFFLLAGIAGHVANSTPTWFIYIDLLFAYLLPAFIGGKLAIRSK